VRLLVSVVSAEEARRAVAGGADIVDVKDPGEGALGAPAPAVVSEVAQVVGGAVPVSVALGDLPDLPHTAALAARGAALSGAAYVKVGLRGARDLDRAVAMMGSGTAKALNTLFALMDDESIAAGVRQRCAATWLENARLVLGPAISIEHRIVEIPAGAEDVESWV